MPGNEHLVAAATDLMLRATELLTQAGEYQAVLYLEQAVAVCRAGDDAENTTSNKVATFLLRMALVLLHRDGEKIAAGHVGKAVAELTP